MNNINVTLELCQEDRNRLDTLIAIGLELVSNRQLVEPAATPAETPQDAAETANAPTAETAHPVGAEAPWGEPASEAPTEEPVREVTPEELQALVRKLAQPGNPKRDKAKNIVQSYAAKVSDVPADKRAECWDKLTALEQEVVE